MKKTPVSTHSDREVFISDVNRFMLITPTNIYCGLHSYYESATPGSICIDSKGNWFSWVLNKNNPIEKQKDGSVRYPNDTVWKKQYGRKPPAMVAALAAIYLN